MTEHARLVITAGEPAGIGPDVVLGALQSPFDAQIAVVGDVQVLEQRAIALGMDLQFALLQPRRSTTAAYPRKSECVPHTLRKPGRAWSARCGERQPRRADLTDIGSITKRQAV